MYRRINMHMYRQEYTPTNRHIQTQTDPHTLSNVFFDQLFLHESLNIFCLEEEGVKEGKKVTKSHVYVYRSNKLTISFTYTCASNYFARIFLAAFQN